MAATNVSLPLTRDEHALDYFVREPFPSAATQTTIRAGRIENNMALKLTSRLNNGGVVFADGIESDFVTFNWGQEVEISVAQRAVRLV